MDELVWVIGTGSRDFTDRELARRSLIRVRNEFAVPADRVVVVHGAQGTRDREGLVVKGLDLILGEEAVRLGMSQEPHPADWAVCGVLCDPGHRRPNPRGSGTYCPTAGHRRNHKMIGLHTYDRCLGFPIGQSSGTRGCMRAAKAVGIVVVNCTERTERDVRDHTGVGLPGEFLWGIQ